MKEHRPEVADVFRQHEQEFLGRWRSALSDRQLRTLRDIGACRTAALGARLYQCEACQRETIVPNSCFMGSFLFWGVRSTNQRYSKFERTLRIPITNRVLLLGWCVPPLFNS